MTIFYKYGLLFLLPYIGISVPIPIQHKVNAFDIGIVSDEKYILPKSIKTIVIDPGHGGNDKGCLGSENQEKKLALQLSKKLKKSLQSLYPQLQILLTRDADYYVSLSDRINIANDVGADLFISIHCNHVNEEYVSGSEIYVLGANHHHQSKDLVCRENHEHCDQDANFLNALKTKIKSTNIISESLRLAHNISDALSKIDSYKNRGVKRAGFHVLRETEMPAILLEAGFLSNVTDEQFLNGESGQLKICDRIIEGFNAYFIELMAQEESYSKYKPEVVKYYKTEPFQTPNINTIKKNKSAINYSIQIATYSEIPQINDNPKWKNLGKVTITQEKNLYNFRIGNFKELSLAKVKQQELISLGFKGASIIQNN